MTIYYGTILIRRSFIVYQFLILLFSPSCNSQKATVNTIEKSIHASFAEKIYIQLNNTTYSTNETVWFKAIVTDVVTNIDKDLSSILYVELIEPEKNKVVETKIVKLQNGISDSFFQLSPSYESGKYLLRAYTEWNKNFDQDFVFHRYIQIFNPKDFLIKTKPITDIVINKEKPGVFKLSGNIYPLELDSLEKGNSTLYIDTGISKDSIAIKMDKEGKYELSHSVPDSTLTIKYLLKTDNNRYTTTFILDDKKIDLQFFPEGGNLIHGIKSAVGFKALDYKGKGKIVEGTIIDENDHIITTFSSNSLGMGKFMVKMDASKKYYACLKGKGRFIYKFPLPMAMREGSVFNVSQDHKFIKLKLESNTKEEDSIYIAAKFRGTTQHIIKAQMQKGEFHYFLKKSILPTGIIELTIYDDTFLPIGERLVFNGIERNRLEIEIRPDKKIYKQRDSIHIDAKVTKEGSVVNANLSVMVVDAEYHNKTNIDQRNILSYFLLESDLRGEIEKPESYFNGESSPEDLDVLLMTQGWRRYKYDKSSGKLDHKVEKNLKVSGYVKGMGKNEKQLDLTVMTFGGESDFYQQRTDSTGRFIIDFPDSYGISKKVVFQTKTLKGKKRTYDIVLDKKEALKIGYDPRERISMVDSVVEGEVKANAKELNLYDPLIAPRNTIALDEVVVTDYKLTPQREKVMKLHGKPDVVLENDKLLKKSKEWHTSIFDVLHFNYSGVVNVDRFQNYLYAYLPSADETLTVVDGIVLPLEQYSLVQRLKVKDIKSIEIIKNAPTAFRYLDSQRPEDIHTVALFNIYTYAGKGISSAVAGSKVKGISRLEIPSFSPKREFYAPKHETVDKEDWDFPDSRKLLLWKPILETDKQGKIAIDFYNADTVGKMKIIVEAITPDGSLGYCTMDYEVVPKNRNADN